MTLAWSRPLPGWTRTVVHVAVEVDLPPRNSHVPQVVPTEASAKGVVMAHLLSYHGRAKMRVLSARAGEPVLAEVTPLPAKPKRITLDRERCVVWIDGEQINLLPGTCKTLALLLDGDVVGWEAIARAACPRSPSKSGAQQQVSLLNKAIGGKVVNIRGRGYALREPA